MRLRPKSLNKAIDTANGWSNRDAMLSHTRERYIFACDSDQEADQWVAMINALKFLQKIL